MKLVIKNLGSLQHAEIDLSKRFYLFTGYNNTGKTYVTKLLYQIFEMKTRQEFAISPYNTLLLDDSETKIELTNDFVNDILKQFALYLRDVVIPNTLKVNPDSSVIKNLHIHFEYNEEFLTNEDLRSEHHFAYEEDLNQQIMFSYLHKEKGTRIANIQIFSKEDIYQKIPNKLLEIFPKDRIDNDLQALSVLPSKLLIPVSIIALLLQNEEASFFLPANRGFLLESANNMLTQKQRNNEKFKEKFLELLRSEETDKDKILRNLEAEMQTDYTFDVDILLNKIEETRKEKRERILQGTGYYNTYLQKMQDIMGGEIVMEKAHSLGYWTEKFKMQGADNEESINLYLASSSANQLALLFQFFKYWAKPERNFLMIDEPEINLHPENQIKVMDLLLSFASEKSNRVLVTTHSPLIGEVLNNYLLANKLGDENATLSIEETVMYAFNGRIMSEQSMGDYGATYLSFKFAQDKVEAESSELMERVYQKLKPVY